MKSLLVVFAFLISHIGTAFAENTPVTPADILVYDVFVRDDRRGDFKDPVSETVRLGEAGSFQAYKPDDARLRIFDPQTLLALSPILATASGDVTISSDRDGSSTEQGATWNVKLIRPPSVGSHCLRTVRSDIKVTVKNIGTASVLVNGQAVDVHAVTVSEDGWWSACGARGQIKGEVIYSPDLNVVLSADSTHTFRNFPNGEKVVLKEVRRGAQ